MQGTAHHAGAGQTLIAPDGGQQRRQSFALVGLFNSAGSDTMVEDDPEALLWSKLIVNAAINALAALLRVPNGELGVEPGCRALMKQVVDEAVQVAQAMGIKLLNADQVDPFKHVLQVCAQTATNRASTLQDILHHAPTEVTVINGAIARLGEIHHVPTPVNSMLTRLVQALEATASERVS